MKNIHISQSGRSMVEMLGVLSIIGVLSIGMLYGFKYAIFRARVSQTLTQISTAVAGARTTNLNNIPIDEQAEDARGNIFIPVHYVISDVKYKPNDPYLFITPLNAEVGVYKDTKNVWRVQINYTEQMSFDDCRALLLSRVTENGIGYGDIVYTQEQLADNEDLLREVCTYYTTPEAEGN